MSKPVLKSHRIPKQLGLAEGEIVLREWREGEWVTHFHNFEDGGYYYGHYFTKLEAAEADFEERVRQESGCVALTEVQGEAIAVPRHILEGIDAVRESRTANMLDVEFVRVQAVALGYPETAEWIKANLEQYMEGVFRGFKACLEQECN